MASRFPVTFFKRKIHTKLPGRLPGVPSRFPVTFWLSKFWTRSSKFHFRALTGKKGRKRDGSIMLYIYRFLPICGMFSAGVRIMHQNRWFCDDLLQNAIRNHRLRHNHTISARPTDSANGRGHQKWPQSGRPPKCHQSASLPNGHLGDHQKTIDLLRNHQIWTSKSPKSGADLV